MDDFVNEPLLEFIDTELGRQHLTDDIRKYRNEGATDDDTLCLILKDCDSYSNSEVLHYQGKLKAFRKLAPPEYLKRKADALFGLKRYGKAVTIYEKILAMNVPPSKKAKVYVVSENPALLKTFDHSRIFFQMLAYASEIILQKDKSGISDDAVTAVIPGADIYMRTPDGRPY